MNQDQMQVSLPAVPGYAAARTRARRELLTRSYRVYELASDYLPYSLLAVPHVDWKLDPFKPVRVVSVWAGHSIPSWFREEARRAMERPAAPGELWEIWCYDLSDDSWSTEGIGK